MTPRRGRIVAILVLALIVGPSVSLLAQQGEGTSSEPAPSSPSEEDDKEARREAKRKARIEEYLRKREERLAQRELERRQKEAEQPVDLGTFSNDSSAETAKADEEKKANRGPDAERVVLPPNLAMVQHTVRTGPLGNDPTVQGYLDLIDRAEASPHQLAAFGSFLADSGWPDGAIEYYRIALSLEPNDPVLWINSGTIHRQMGKNRAAIDAYRRALSIDPNYADAHYNLGAAYDVEGKYEEALHEYKVALTLDPDLGDPSLNPLASNNPRLLAVKLLLYEEQAGNLGLPLHKVAGGELTEDSEAGSGGP